MTVKGVCKESNGEDVLPNKNQDGLWRISSPRRCLHLVVVGGGLCDSVTEGAMPVVE